MNKLATGYQLALQELHIFLGSCSSQLPIVFFFLNVFLDENVLIPLGEIPIKSLLRLKGLIDKYA